MQFYHAFAKTWNYAKVSNLNDLDFYAKRSGFNARYFSTLKQLGLGQHLFALRIPHISLIRFLQALKVCEAQ